ncbi:MAG: type I DNA topoisomerase [Hyphomicrobiaceae bacterium]
MQVVIVESAAKAKTINKYLGSDYKVIASFGHVRDLPAKNGSVEPDNDFNMHWDVDGSAQKVMKEITSAVKKADKLILATDPDREGEAISWHILEVLREKKALKDKPVERVAFNAVTKKAILKAMAEPREIDSPLVDAYMARRALDYLVGFTLSPVLWRKLPGARSAGRVQSVALRLVCEREAEIEAFVSQEYWSVTALLETASNDAVTARLVAIDGKKLDKFDIKDDASASAIKAAIIDQDFKVTSIQQKATKRNPSAPFTTSTLQQEASRKLGFNAKQTMQIAQRLYEGIDIGGETVGLITYMRTDGVQITPEAVSEIRDLIVKNYSKNYVAPFVREYKSKAKNAQEAHEAVRPTNPSLTPQDLAKNLQKDQLALYDLIWKRSIASQMASAELAQTSVEISTNGRDKKSYGLRANGSVVTFDGFMKIYEEGRDDVKDDDSRRLPPLNEGDNLSEQKVEDGDAIIAKQHFTEPPPRFTEATLVKRMEELGIGRPSTFASTLGVLRDRAYIRDDQKRLIPEDKGRLVIAFLESYFHRYVEYDFTANLEEQLDLISDDKLNWKDVLAEFWKNFNGSVEEIKDLRISEVLDALNELLAPAIFPPKEDGSDPRICPKCGVGKLSLRVGKNGAFVACGNYPECRFTRQFSTSGDDDASSFAGDKHLGDDPETGLPVMLRAGRFGPYIQLGEGTKDEKPKRSGIPKGMDPETVDFEFALKLLSLPRVVGEHPETKKEITAGLGRYGPFVLHDGMYANVESLQDVFDIGVNRAVVVLAEKAAGGGKGRFQRQKATVLKDLGEHPIEGGPMQVLDGRYGPYIKHNKINATVPKGTEPTDVTVDEAVQLLAERAAKAGKKKKKPAKKKATAKKKTPTKKKTAKKAASKKAPAKKTAKKTTKKPAAKKKAAKSKTVS